MKAKAPAGIDIRPAASSARGFHLTWPSEQFLRAATILLLAGVHGSLQLAEKSENRFTSVLLDTLPYVQQALLLVWLFAGTWPLIWRLVFAASVLILAIRDRLLHAEFDGGYVVDFAAYLLTLGDTSYIYTWSKIGWVQALALSALLIIARIAGWRMTVGTLDKPRPAQFSLRAILLFITAIGLILGLAQISRQRFGPFDAPVWLVCSEFGLTFAVSMLLVATTVLSRHFQPLTFSVIGIGVPLLLAIAIPYSCHRMDDWLEAEGWVLTYTVTAASSLYVLRLGGYRWSRGSASLADESYSPAG